jgi:hypothetical protein
MNKKVVAFIFKYTNSKEWTILRSFQFESNIQLSPFMLPTTAYGLVDESDI